MVKHSETQRLTGAAFQSLRLAASRTFAPSARHETNVFSAKYCQQTAVDQVFLEF